MNYMVLSAQTASLRRYSVSPTAMAASRPAQPRFTPRITLAENVRMAWRPPKAYKLIIRQSTTALISASTRYCSAIGASGRMNCGKKAEKNSTPLGLDKPTNTARQNAAAPPALCHAWGDLSASEADRLVQRLRRIGITAARSRSETPEAWWVRIPPQRNRGEAERRVVELNLLGVSDTFIVQESGPNQNAVSLGLFKTENRARILLGQLRAKGVENAGIEPRMSTSYRIQANVPANELRIVESAAPGLRAKRQACTR